MIKKNILIVAAILLVIIIASVNMKLIFCKPAYKNANDKLQVASDTKLRYLATSYVYSGNVAPYGFIEEDDLNETLIYYYFNLNDDNKENFQAVCKSIYELIDKTELSSDNSNEYIDYIYFLSLIRDKFEIDNFAYEYVDKLFFHEATMQDSLVKKNNLWKLLVACGEDTERQQRIHGAITSCSFDDLTSEVDKFSNRAIDVVMDGDIDKIRQVYKEISDFHYKEIHTKSSGYLMDDESFTIIVNVLLGNKELTLSKRDLEQINTFLEMYGNTESSYVRFIGYRIIENEINRSDEVREAYSSLLRRHVYGTAVSDKGYAPKRASLVVTNKRLLEYYELAVMVGVQGFNNPDTYYESIDREHVMYSTEELYYRGLLNKINPQFTFDDTYVRSYLRQFNDIEIKDENAFMAVNLMRVANLRGINAKKLIKKLEKYCDNNKSIFSDIWKLEIELGKFKFKSNIDIISEVEDEILKYDGDNKCEVYYQFVELLNRYNKEIGEEVSGKILAYINDSYVEHGDYAGYTEDIKYRAIDMSVTYKCLYMKQVLER